MIKTLICPHHRDRPNWDVPGFSPLIIFIVIEHLLPLGALGALRVLSGSSSQLRVYQTCYHDTRYFSFKIMDYDGPDSIRGLTGMILSYDNICHQYNVVINIIQNPSIKENQYDLSPSVIEPVNQLPNKMNWSSYNLSRGSKKSRAHVVKLNLPCQTVLQKTVPTLPCVTDLQSMFKF